MTHHSTLAPSCSGCLAQSDPHGLAKASKSRRVWFAVPVESPSSGGKEHHVPSRKQDSGSSPSKTKVLASMALRSNDGWQHRQPPTRFEDRVRQEWLVWITAHTRLTQEQAVASFRVHSNPVKVLHRCRQRGHALKHDPKGNLMRMALHLFAAQAANKSSKNTLKRPLRVPTCTSSAFSKKPTDGTNRIAGGPSGL